MKEISPVIQVRWSTINSLLGGVGGKEAASYQEKIDDLYFQR